MDCHKLIRSGHGEERGTEPRSPERALQAADDTELARQTHLSRKAILDIELRRTRPRLDTASRIAKALNVAVTDLFAMEEVIG
jgi:DNA-binding XRE family transcriptional regulator